MFPQGDRQERRLDRAFFVLQQPARYGLAVAF
jgi:hypothetical protein